VFDEFEPVPALDAIERYGVTHISSVPTLTSRIADVDGVAERDLSSVECWINMGSPLSRVTAERFIETLTPNIFNNYGTTESLTDTVLRPDDLPEHAGTAGRPTIDTQVRVVELGTGRRVDPDETVPVGEKGQVVVRGASVFDCYYGNTAATKRAFTDGWFYTKDIGHKDEAGYLTITGRADDMILSGGELVSPFEVEDALEEHEGVEAAIVVGQPDEEWGERVRAYVVADGVTEDDLVAFCRAHDGLADYKRPRVWTFTDELERTATGKKQRFKYRED
jgi:acyl-CoA synthetase (AMP-forming)/AMP-acid ligase II